MSSSGNSAPQQAQNTYYCHICARNITGLTADYACPICQGGFVELVENVARAPNQIPAGTGNSVSLGSINLGPNDVNTFVRQVTPFFNYVMTPQQHQTPATSTSQSGQPAVAAPQIQPGVLQGFIQNLLQGLTNNANVEVQFRFNGDGGATGFAFPVPLHGNVADYAWGPGGLDAIVTQLLNQVEGGAPPMQKSKIDELPEALVSKEQVEKRIQCAVCMEDFKLSEKVCRIACEHLFHRDCIVPWLERHNSCPVCRKSAETGEPLPGSPPVTQPGFTLFGGGPQATPTPGPNQPQQSDAQVPPQQYQPASGAETRPASGGNGSGAGRPSRWMDIEDLD